MRRALLIGINDYPDQKALFGCLNDVAVMERILREQFEFSDIETLTEAAATRDGIRAGIERLVGKTEQGDIVLFYYAGHGSQIFAESMGEGDFFDETIVPWDSVHAGERPNTDIRDDELNEWLVKGLTNKTGNVTLIFDSCHSKSISRDSSGGRTRSAERDVRPVAVHQNPGPALPSGTRSTARSRSGWLPQDDSYVLMAGCRDEELSGEIEVETGGETIHHGAFTYYLAQELKNMAPGTAYRTVFERAAAKVAIEQAGKQHPQIEGRLDHVIFGDKAVEQMQYVRALPVEGLPGQVKLETGAAMGARVGAVWAVYPQGTTAVDDETPKLGEVTIVQVGAVESLAEWQEEPAEALDSVGGWAVLVSQNWGEMALRVAVVAEEAEAEALKTAVNERAGDLIQFVGSDQSPTMVIKYEPPATEADRPQWVVFQSGTLVLPAKPVGEAGALREIANNLRKAAIYRNAIQISNPNSSLAGNIDFDLVLWDGENWEPATPNEGGEIVLKEGKPNYLSFTIGNNSDQVVYCNLLDFGLNWEIDLWYPDPPTKEGEFFDTDSFVEIPSQTLAREAWWWYEMPENFPLVGGTKALLTGGERDIEPAEPAKPPSALGRGAKRSRLERLMAMAWKGSRSVTRSGDGDDGSAVEPENIPDETWTTIERSIIVQRVDDENQVVAEGRVMFKLFVSTKPADFSWLSQGSARSAKGKSKKREAALIPRKKQAGDSEARPELVVRLGHHSEIETAVFSPDGSQALTVGGDQVAILWDVASGRDLARFRDRRTKGRILSAVFASDGQRFYTAGEDQIVRIWDVARRRNRPVRQIKTDEITKKLLTGMFANRVTPPDPDTMAWNGRVDQTLLAHFAGRKLEGVLAENAEAKPFVALAPDGRHVFVSLSGGPSQLWAIRGSSPREGFKGACAAAFLPDSDRLIVGENDGNLNLLDIGQKAVRTVWREQAGQGAVTALGCSPDGRFVLSGDMEGVVRIWQVDDGELTADARSLDFESAVRLIDFSSDGRYLLAGSDNELGLYRWPETTGELERVQLFEGGFSAVFSPDGHHILSADQNGAFYLINIGTGEWESMSGPFFDWAAFSEDGRQIYAGTEGQLSVSKEYHHTGQILVPRLSQGKITHRWEIDKEEMVEQSVEIDSIFRDYGYITLSPNGRFALTSGEGRATMVIDLERATVASFLVGHEQPPETAAFSAGGQRVVTGGAGGLVQLWETATGERVGQVDIGQGVTAVALSADGENVLVGTEKGRVLGWGGETVEPIEIGKHRHQVTAVAFSPGGLALLSGSTDSNVIVRSLEAGFEERYRYHHDAGVVAASFSPDGRYLLTASRQTPYLLDTAVDDNQGTVRHILADASSQVGGVSFSEDGMYFLTGTDSETVMWCAKTGHPVRIFKTEGKVEGHEGLVNQAEFTPGGKRVMTVGEDKSARLWSITDANFQRVIRDLEVHSAVLIGDGSSILIGSDSRKAYKIDSESGRPVRINGESALANPKLFRKYHIRKKRGSVVQQRVTGIAISPDGRFVIKGTPDKWLTVTDLHERPSQWDSEVNQENDKVDDWHYPLKFLPDSSGFLTVSNATNSAVWLVDIASGERLRSLIGHEGRVTAIDLRPNPELSVLDGESYLVATASDDGTIRLWKLPVERESAAARQMRENQMMVRQMDVSDMLDVVEAVQVLEGHSGSVRDVALSPDGRFAVSSGEDNTVRLWDCLSGEELCRIIMYQDGTWVVVDGDGRLDTNNLESLQGLFWQMPDDPEAVLPVEIFVQNYYEPQLLAKIMAGESLPPVEVLTDINRLQPEVTIEKLTLNEAGAGSTVTAVVRVEPVMADGKSSGAKDLYLFREGQLVGYREELTADTETYIFEDIKVPLLAGMTELNFSAYAFNEDGVKSATVWERLRLPELPAQPGKIYILSVGVNDYGNEEFNLSFAAQDARAMNETLGETLNYTLDALDLTWPGGVNRFSEVVALSLVSDGAKATGTKGHLKAVFDVLAGREGETAVLDEIENADRVTAVRPEDLIILSFAGHGHSGDGIEGEQGVFYLMMGDSLGDETTLSNSVLGRSVSSDELTEWLQDVDAGDMAFIIDACHSASSVEGTGFKPGPMGNKGLGQLAYNKGMLILAASQADEVALEHPDLQQGLLTYALVQNGLKERQADSGSDYIQQSDNRIELSEWLAFGARRVPLLYQEVLGDGSGSRGKLVLGRGKGSDRPIEEVVEEPQQPAMFNFRRKGEAILLWQGG